MHYHTYNTFSYHYLAAIQMWVIAPHNIKLNELLMVWDLSKKN